MDEKLELEVGKCYRDSEGKKRGPMRLGSADCQDALLSEDLISYFRTSGGKCLSTVGRDLVAAWPRERDIPADFEDTGEFRAAFDNEACIWPSATGKGWAYSFGMGSPNRMMDKTPVHILRKKAAPAERPGDAKAGGGAVSRSIPAPQEPPIVLPDWTDGDVLAQCDKLGLLYRNAWIADLRAKLECKLLPAKPISRRALAFWELVNRLEKRD
jgi:hypothetical protein